MAFSNPPEHKDDSIDSIARYFASFHDTKADGMEYFYNTSTGKQEMQYLGTPLATWTRIAKWCKEQNFTVEQLADSLEKQK